MTNRFDLEQQILKCWNVTDDIRLMVKRGASEKSIESLAAVYEVQFQELWNIFETMCSEKQFVTTVGRDTT